MAAAEIDDYRAELAGLRRELFDVKLALLEQKYRPDQPRVPGGQAGGGQWAGDGAAGNVSVGAEADASVPIADGPLQDVANRQAPPAGPVSLLQEEVEGGHAVRDHVGKSNSDLVQTLNMEQYDGPILRVYGYQEGSFDDLGSADRYVNDVLASNKATVDAVASGQSDWSFLIKRYSSPTGREAYRLRVDPEGVIRLRPTFWVGALIVHVGHGKGLSVRTAYPTNKETDY